MGDTRNKNTSSPVVGGAGWPWTAEAPSLPPLMPDGTPWPRISIITPSFNQGQFIEETIRSVLMQGYPNLEYIIIDGGSTDGTLDIIRRYESRLTYWVSEKDDGQTYAIEKGMQAATGEIVNWLNSDDLLLPGALQAVAAAYRSSPQKECVLCGGAVHIAEDGRVIAESRVVPVQDKILPDAPPLTGGIQASWFLSRSAWDRVGGIDASLNYTMDMDLYYRCGREHIEFVPIKELLAVYRRHFKTKTLEGWRGSIAAKERHFSSQLTGFPENEKRFFRKKIRQRMFGYYLASITSQDSLPRRIEKVALALMNNPFSLSKPYQVNRIIRLLVKGEMGG